MQVSDFEFDLPAELVAQTPAARGHSRLLVLDRATGTVRHASIRDLPEHLVPGDLLVANDTRVFPARLLGHRVPSGGAVECLLLARVDEGPGVESADSRCEVWDALMHPGQKLKPGARVRFEREGTSIDGEVLERHFHGRRRLRLCVPSGTVAQAVDALGHIPLPPYIHRDDTPADRERYQTIFARARGSVAAPTAGLHFDDALLAAIAARGVARASVTLHVGYGTFKPVRVDDVERHEVDAERFEVGVSAAAAINGALDERRRIVAVGTTTTRALEQAALFGGGRVAAGEALATVFIYPGFEFRVVGALLTNFHLPRSSLLMLVCAFAGREAVLAAYREAVAERYRFYSYGDAMLIV
jgi:S-adenosylmethionine:tRNA ribosyltransferase-isomerase